MTKLSHFILSILFFAGSIQAEELFLFVTNEGPPYPAQLVGYDDGGVDILDPDVGHRSIPDSECMVLVRPTSRIDLSGTPHLRLKDGQTFIGQPSSSSPPEQCVWIHPRLGQLSIPMEHIDSIHLHPQDTPFTPSPEFDQVRLRNNDVLSGFITEIGNPIQIEVDRAGTTDVIQVPWGRIASVHLFGEQSAPTFPRVWFRDGTIVSFPTLAFDDDWWLQVESHPHLAPEGPRAPNPPTLGMVHAIAFDSTPFIPLGGLPVSRVQIPPTRMTNPGPTITDPSAVLHLSPIECSGPATFHWQVPDAMDWFQSTVRLPVTMQRWGDVQIRFLVDDIPVHEVRLNGSSPVVDIDLPVSGKVFTIMLLEGENGPIQDTVVFEYPMFKSTTGSPGG